MNGQLELNLGVSEGATGASQGLICATLGDFAEEAQKILTDEGVKVTSSREHYHHVSEYKWLKKEPETLVYTFGYNEESDHRISMRFYVRQEKWECIYNKLSAFEESFTKRKERS